MYLNNYINASINGYLHFSLNKVSHNTFPLETKITKLTKPRTQIANGFHTASQPQSTGRRAWDVLL